MNTDLLKPEMFQNLHASVANLQATTKNFQLASEKLNGVLDDAHGVVAGAREAIDGAKGTLATTDKAADDLRKVLGDASQDSPGSARDTLDTAIHGNGLVATLLSDRTVSDDLAALVSNLRRSGVLFYRNRPDPSATPSPAPTPRRAPTR